MPDPLPQRKRPHHLVSPVTHRPTIVFLTVCTKLRRPILANASTHDAIVATWKGATAWRVGRYVVMPDHLHLFATPGEPELELENWVTFWKRGLSKTLGSGAWQEGYWDRTLRTDDSYAEKWDYVRNNPVRHGFVERAEDWPYQGELNELDW